VPVNKNDLGRHVLEQYHDEISGSLMAWISKHPGSLKKKGNRSMSPGAVSLRNMHLRFLTNVTIVPDIVSFDAVLSCEIGVKEWTFDGWRNDVARQWYRVSCSLKVEDAFADFSVHAINTYSRMPHPNHYGSVDKNLVPVISAKDFEAEAARFLAEFCPEALVYPMPVPIDEIVTKRMGLALIRNGCLSDDFSYMGQLHFFPGMAKVYNVLCDGTEDVSVKRGTILIDAMTYWERNIGCLNNTIAHEAVHWFLHRVYAFVQCILSGGEAVAYRCPAKPAEYYGSEASAKWSDEERMEWQANGIAPRILMPANTFKIKVEEFYTLYGYRHNESGQTLILERVIRALAEFYHVSKQSARIRMEELGYTEVTKVNKYNSDTRYFTRISLRDSFYEYCDNSDFRSLIDSGLFRYIDNQYIIDDERYIQEKAGGGYELTSYAWNHLSECALRFITQRVDMKARSVFHKDTFHRTNKNAYEKLPGYSFIKNKTIIDNAEELKQNRELFEQEYVEFSEYAATFYEKVDVLMKQRNWYPATFKDKTLLNDMDYSRYMTDRTKAPSLARVMAICIGLDVDQRIAVDLLAAAGYRLNPTREHQAYQFALNHYRGRIDECNDFLVDRGFRPLGAQSRQ